MQLAKEQPLRRIFHPISHEESEAVLEGRRLVLKEFDVLAGLDQFILLIGTVTNKIRSWPAVAMTFGHKQILRIREGRPKHILHQLGAKCQ